MIKLVLRLDESQNWENPAPHKSKNPLFCFSIEEVFGLKKHETVKYDGGYVAILALFRDESLMLSTPER